jgi:glycogen operon protein
MYAEGSGKYGVKEDCFIYTAVNAHWEEHTFTLPIIPENLDWFTAFDTAGAACCPGQEIPLNDKQSLSVPPRTVVILITKGRS